MSKTLQEFYNDLGARESGGNYRSVNKYGYIGKYQMGEAAMEDAGYYKKPSRRYNNDWSGQFTGKDGVYSVEDFLNNEQAQENAQTRFKQAQWNQLKAIGVDKYIGKEINNVEVTPSGLLAAAHLKGPGEVKKYLLSEGKNNPKDAFGTSVESYMKNFSGYNVSQITGLNNAIEYTSLNKNDYNNSYSPTPFKIGIEYNDYKNNGLSSWKDIPMAIPESWKQLLGQPTGQAAGIEHIFTPEEIGKMTPEEFNKYESQIMAQVKAGKIEENQNNTKMYLINSPNTVLYTREDIGNMSTKEYEKHENAIKQQMKTIGIPYNREVPKGTKTYGREKSSRSNSSESSSEDGRWVTINGNHVFIED